MASLIISHAVAAMAAAIMVPTTTVSVKWA